MTNKTKKESEKITISIVDRSMVKKIEKPDKSTNIKKKRTKKQFYEEVDLPYWSEWKKIFLVGTEWNIYDESYRFPWDFDHLYEKLEKKEFKGKYIYSFGSTEPQMITLSNGMQTSAPM
jgi:hypothetical protein